jgi:hypothetical protein
MPGLHALPATTNKIFFHNLDPVDGNIAVGFGA